MVVVILTLSPRTPLRSSGSAREARNNRAETLLKSNLARRSVVGVTLFPSPQTDL